MEGLYSSLIFLLPLCVPGIVKLIFMIIVGCGTSVLRINMRGHHLMTNTVQI